MIVAAVDLARRAEALMMHQRTVSDHTRHAAFVILALGIGALAMSFVILAYLLF
jgi:hypothetical protein